VIIVNGTINQQGVVRISSNKTIIGATNSSLIGVNLFIKDVSNVIIRNMNVSKVVGGDAITIQNATNVWVDHCELFSDLLHDKDYYDGLLDITHGSDYISVTNTRFHDHWKTSLVGHSDSNRAQDAGRLHITYARNVWTRVNSRTPSVRFGIVHVFDSLYTELGATGVNARMGAQVLVETTVFSNFAGRAIETADSVDVGYAVLRNDVLGDAINSAPLGNLTQVPYNYTLLGTAAVQAGALSSAGPTLLI
jgi:pectate lyase